ncbi:hypothetical protein Pcinc_021593 [Petrolisthes cinctipes]|uniref:U3 small nucleolar RNA-associated protein 18-like protein n=1 Tax=Petrolisthes cinctipes TaxID=88211 RepID=A0AAE1FHN7_PETCI|nr:hypothetical protein Pcinc_021593 [Petrolisthes cinctipes]
MEVQSKKRWTNNYNGEMKSKCANSTPLSDKQYSKLVNRDRVLTSDLFGGDLKGPEDLQQPPSPSVAITIHTGEVKTEKKVKCLIKVVKAVEEETSDGSLDMPEAGAIRMKKKKKLNAKRKKNMVPDDPFDVHEQDITEVKRKPVWIDEEDEKIKVKDIMATMRKAPGSRGSRETSEKQYSLMLRDKYSQLIPGGTPEWADLDRKVDDAEDDEIGRMGRTTGDYLAKSSSAILPNYKLEYRKVTDLNHTSKQEGSIIKVVQFNKYLPVGLVAGKSNNTSGAASLFKVDGVDNHKIQSVKFPGFPITCGNFLDAKRFLVGSLSQSYFYVYDMEIGKETKYPCNFGQSKNTSTGAWTSKDCIVSPDEDQVVFFGKCGALYLYDPKTMTHVATLYAPGHVTSATFSDNGTKMYTYGDGGDVCVWDMVNRVCVHRFYDDGCVDGCSIAMKGNYLACGSSSGVVNVYDTSSLTSSTSPAPIKSLTRLTTAATSLAFNPSAEILATVTSYSNVHTKAIKLVHLPSFEYFQNFPFQHKGVYNPQVTSFSPHGGYLAIGTNKRTANLYRLYHYTSY